MRVISGSRRGRKLNGFEGDFIRPTTDRVKESLFNLIQGRTEGAIVFDAFCGSGALGIEAVSRGANFVYCTDTDSRSCKIISENYALCLFEDKYSLSNLDAVSFLSSTNQKFDLVFLDPPYNKGLVTPVLKIISERGLLNEGGSIVIERDGEADTFELCGFTLEKERKYGRTIISVLMN